MLGAVSEFAHMGDRMQLHRQVALQSPGGVLSLAVALLFAVVLLPHASGAAEYDPGLVQIQLTPDVTIGWITAHYGATVVDSLPPLYLLQVPSGMDEAELVEQMTPDTTHIVCAERALRDETPEGVRQMVVAAVGGTIEDYLDQEWVERLHLEAIHAFAQGEGVLVAVLDTGVVPEHEALAGAIAAGGYDFVDDDDDPRDEANGIDDDGDGLFDEGAGHGTLVAGIIHRVAPAAQILPIRVLDDEGRGSTFTLAKGIRRAVESGADVINMSLGMTVHSGIIAHELAQARLASRAMVSAAGNDGVDTLLYYPASDIKVLMVAALDASDIKADFSNYHAKVALSAPGVGILGPYYDGGYAIGAGTSFATAFVSAQCALIIDLDPGIDCDQLYQQAMLGVHDVYDIPANHPYIAKLGTGRVDGLETLLTSAPSATAGSDPLNLHPLVGLRVQPSLVQGPGALSLSGPGIGPDEPGRIMGLYDLAGRRLRTLTLDPTGTIAWDGRDDAGRRLPAGTYLLRTATPAGNALIGRLVIVR
jgi:subtilisin family serine protease